MAGQSQSGLWAGMLVTNPRDAEGFERDYRGEKGKWGNIFKEVFRKELGKKNNVQKKRAWTQCRCILTV